MARRKLIEYLNDPALLTTISVEEMQAWAKEAPYAGLVQRLLVQKLLLDSSDDRTTEKATTLAILASAQPEVTIQSIEDFKQMILSNDEGATTHEAALGHSVSDPESQMDSGLSEGDPKDDAVVVNSEQSEETLSPINAIDAEDHHVTQLNDDKEDIDDNEFSLWLDSLKTLEVQDEEDLSPIELEVKELASDTLAEVLVSQGHYDRAIAMYEILMLKNPQKSSFFAAQIQKLKAL